MLSFLALAGCSLDVEEPKQLLWEGQLEAVGDSSDLGGSVAAIARDATTEAGIEVTSSSASVGDRWIWRLGEGTCQSPGDPIGAAESYPVLEAREDETSPAPGGVVLAEGLAILGETLFQGNDYYVRVAAEDTPDDDLACANLAVS